MSLSANSNHVRTVHTSVPKAADVEIHVSEIDSGEHGNYVEIREYIPSIEQYGRGLTFPWDADNLDDVIAALKDIRAAS